MQTEDEKRRKSQDVVTVSQGSCPHPRSPLLHLALRRLPCGFPGPGGQGHFYLTFILQAQLLDLSLTHRGPPLRSHMSSLGFYDFFPLSFKAVRTEVKCGNTCSCPETKAISKPSFYPICWFYFLLEIFLLWLLFTPC